MMVTVGYGDSHPVTDIERVLNMFTMLISCGVFGYIVS
jgi:hypothetical protein